MANITKRATKGSALTATEHDLNLDAVLERAKHTGTQTSATIIDFTQAVQDAITALFGNPLLQTLADAPTITFDYTLGYNGKITLGGNRTLNITNIPVGGFMKLTVYQDTSGGRLLAMPANVAVMNNGAGVVPLTSTPHHYDSLTFYNNGITIECNYGLNYTSA